ncbi:MAG: hypothetical protein ACYCW6_00600 [Candidatus Xenobia bacterium]
MAAAISRSQFYYYAMKLRDKLIAEPGIAHPYWSVPKIDRFLQHVDRYCLPTLTDISRSVTRERSGFRRRVRAAVVGAIGCFVLAALALRLFEGSEGAIIASLLVAGMSGSILLGVHGWEAAESRTVLLMQLYVWEQAIRSMGEEALAPPFKEETETPGRVRLRRKAVQHAWN